MEETETEEQPTNRMIVKDMKGMQAMFRSIPREKLQEKYLEEKKKIPEAGIYRSRFESI